MGGTFRFFLQRVEARGTELLPSVWAGWARIGLHQSTYRLKARAIMISAAIITNPTETSNGLTS